MSNSGRNFDNIVEKFAQNIYGTTKGKIRWEILWQDLNNVLNLFLPQQELLILDVGGGEGKMSCELAKRGYKIIYCDLSEKMVEKAQQLAEAEKVSERILFLSGSIQQQVKQLNQPVDLILCHAVLEWVSEQQDFIGLLTNLLKPHGILSLMFYNWDALFFRNVLLGNFDYIKAGMKKRKTRTLSPDHPLVPDKVYHWLTELSLTIHIKTGVRIFHDYLFDKQMPEREYARLLALEKQYCHHSPFLELGRYIHVVAQK